jgi:hypothetical protein
MDNKQSIHIACEGILIGGLSLYFAKQLKHQHKEIEELKTVIAKNQAANEKRFEVLFNFLDNVNGGFVPSQPRQQPERYDRVEKIERIERVEKEDKVKKQPVKPIIKKVSSKVVDIEEEPKRLPQKKKVKIQTVEEPSVLDNITKKNIEINRNEDVCDPNDEECTDDIQEEMGTLLEPEEIEESLETDMDD